METVRILKTLVETLVSNYIRVLEKTQNVPDTFSDTPESPDTLLDTVLDTLNDISKSYKRLEWPHHNSTPSPIGSALMGVRQVGVQDFNEL